MRAYDLALEMYDEEFLLEILAHCSRVGGVYIDNDELICGYPTNSSYIETKSKKGLDIADTWFIYIAVGNVAKAYKVFDSKPYIAFERFDGNIRLLEFERVRRLIDGYTRRTGSPRASTGS
jgi:hypothetical protein